MHVGELTLIWALKPHITIQLTLARPPRIQILSFRHTKISKRNRFGSQRPPLRG